MEKKKGSYISAKESRRISRENRKITAAIEKQRNRKHVDPSEYLCEMKDPSNVVASEVALACAAVSTGTHVAGIETGLEMAPQAITNTKTERSGRVTGKEAGTSTKQRKRL